MDDDIEKEEEQGLSQKVYQELNARADLQQQTISLQQEAISLQEETIGLQKEQLQLKDQLIAKLEYECVLLREQVQRIQDQGGTEFSGGSTPSASVRFSRPPKNMLKKHRRKHG